MLDGLLWKDGGRRKIYFLGVRGVSCGSLVRERGTTIEMVCAHCLGTQGRHFFCGVVNEWFNVSDALQQIANTGSLALPAQWSNEAIPVEAIEIFQQHAPEIGAVLGDRTRDIVLKTSKVKGNPYPFFELTHFADANRKLEVRPAYS